jgi:hypothetical protein
MKNPPSLSGVDRNNSKGDSQMRVDIGILQTRVDAHETAIGDMKNWGKKIVEEVAGLRGDATEQHTATIERISKTETKLAYYAGGIALAGFVIGIVIVVAAAFIGKI